MFRIGGAIPIRFSGSVVLEQPNGVCFKISVSGVSDLNFVIDALQTVSLVNMAPSFHKIFGGKKTLPEDFMRKCMVSGGAVTISEKLVRDHGWDGEKLMAAPVMVVEAGVVADSHWVLLGKLKDVVFSASSVWARADKRLKVTVRLDDLSVFSFSSSNSTPNLSAWLDQEDLDMVSFSTVGQGGETLAIDFNEAKQLGAGGCLLRL